MRSSKLLTFAFAILCARCVQGDYTGRTTVNSFLLFSFIADPIFGVLALSVKESDAALLTMNLARRLSGIFLWWYSVVIVVQLVKGSGERELLDDPILAALLVYSTYTENQLTLLCLACCLAENAIIERSRKLSDDTESTDGG